MRSWITWVRCCGTRSVRRCRWRDAEATEGEDATLDFVVKLDGNSGSEVKVDYRTRDGTAEAGSDYTETRGRLTFDPGRVREDGVGADPERRDGGAVRGADGKLRGHARDPTTARAGSASGWRSARTSASASAACARMRSR